MDTEARRRGLKISNGLLYKKRKHTRFKVDGLVCDIADGNSILGGIIEDVSSGGFKMSNLPRNLDSESASYRAIISGNGNHYRVVVVPCWSEKPESSRSAKVGFKIIDASWEWTDFIMNTAAIGETYDHPCC